MGGSSSRTRKFTLENENPMSVIKVSDEVVDRMKNTCPAPGVKNAMASTGGQWPQGMSQGPPSPYLYQPSLTSIQIRQANVEALKENDKYWDKRIESLQKGHKEMEKIMEDEYLKAINEMGVHKKDPKKISTIPCLDNRKKVMACYKKYPNEPMKCAQEVLDFAQCVDLKRASVVENLG